MTSALEQLMCSEPSDPFVGMTLVQDSGEPFTLAEAKLFLRVDGTDEDVLITALMSAARVSVESWVGRQIGTQTWEMTLDRFPASSRVQLMNGPAQAITTVKTFDNDDAESTFNSSEYFLDTAGDRLALNQGSVWPTDLRPTNAVIIRYTTGFINTPYPLIQGIRQLLAHFYENREAVVAGSPKELPLGVQALLQPHRRLRL